MTERARRTVAAVAVATWALAGCSAPAAREPAAEPVYGPPVLGEWIEIEGRWEVTVDDREGEGLLQTAVGELDEDELRGPGVARWIDTTTGAVLWERDDIGEVLYAGEGRLVAATGAGAERQFAAIDVENGATLWSIPESEIGDCPGWDVVDTWDRPESDGGATPTSPEGTEGESAEQAGTLPRLALRGPTAGCGTDERALLVELDAATGEHVELLRAAGTVTSIRSGDNLVVVSRQPAAATLTFFDEKGAPVSTVMLDAATLLAGTDVATLTDSVQLDLEEMREGRPWLQVAWFEDETRYFLNEFLLDPVAGTATPQPNEDCAAGPGERYRHQADFADLGSETLNWCIVSVVDTGESQVRTDVGGGTAWTAPSVPGRAWRVSQCRGVVDDPDDDRPLLLGAAADAQLRAFDLLTGEVLWSLDEGQTGEMAVSPWPHPDRAIVVTQGADGRQLLRTLRLCTGEVLTEDEISGVRFDDGVGTAMGWTITIPLEQTTMLATFHPRGTEPEVPDSDGT